MRDDFLAKTKETIAKRVNYFCSHPDCRKPTTGPSKVEDKSVNARVAAHITAASKGGCRYDSSISADERKSVKNGIWLCQTCAKLIDSDEVCYPTELLQKWKSDTETFAKLALLDSNQISTKESANRKQILNKMERQMSGLFSEIRNDLSQHPFRREFIIISKDHHYWAKGNELVYYFEDHPELRSKLQILQNLNLIKEITYNNTERFIILEELAEYISTNE